MYETISASLNKLRKKGSIDLPPIISLVDAYKISDKSTAILYITAMQRPPMMSGLTNRVFDAINSMHFRR